MRDRIYLYEMERYQQETEEMRGKLRADPNRYFDFSDLPSREIHKMLETFIWERGKYLAPSSLASELLYYNNIRTFLIERDIKELSPEKEDQILRMLKAWMLAKGYALTSQKFRKRTGSTATESPSIINYMRRFLQFIRDRDGRSEQEKDIWNLEKFDFPIQMNPIKNAKRIGFTEISQADIKEEVKKVVYMHLKFMPLGTIHKEIGVMKKFARYLIEKDVNIASLQELQRDHIEDYLTYLRTEQTEVKSFRADLYALKRVIEDVGNLYERPHMLGLFLTNDFPSTPKYQFKFYTDAEIKRLNEHIIKMDEQICRAFMIHQLLGTRISDTLTLKMDCMSLRENRYFVRIDQVKSVTYEKAVSDELAQLILKAMDYTREHCGETKYIFVSVSDPEKPYQYGVLREKIVTLIKENDIRDDHGELLKFGTHIFRHCYGKKLTEMHVDDWMIARLLGHKTLQSVHYYRKIGNKMMADETRAAREEMDLILLDIVKDWDGYEI